MTLDDKIEECLKAVPTANLGWMDWCKQYHGLLKQCQSELAKTESDYLERVTDVVDRLLVRDSMCVGDFKLLLDKALRKEFTGKS